MKKTKVVICCVIALLASALYFGSSPELSGEQKADVERAKSLLAEQQIELTALAKEYNEQVQKAAHVLESKMLADKAEVAKSLLLVAELERFIPIYFDRQRAVQQELLEKSKTFFSSTEFKEGFEKGFHEGRSNSDRLLTEYKRNQLALVGVFKDILTFAAKTDIQVSDQDELLIEDEKAAENYDAMYTNLQRLMADEQKILTEIRGVQQANEQKVKLLDK